MGGENPPAFARKGDGIAPAVGGGVAEGALAGQQQHVVVAQQRPPDGAAGAANQLIFGVDGRSGFCAGISSALKQTDASRTRQTRGVHRVVGEFCVGNPNLSQRALQGIHSPGYQRHFGNVALDLRLGKSGENVAHGIEVRHRRVDARSHRWHRQLPPPSSRLQHQRKTRSRGHVVEREGAIRPGRSLHQRIARHQRRLRVIRRPVHERLHRSIGNEHQHIGNGIGPVGRIRDSADRSGGATQAGNLKAAVVRAALRCRLRRQPERNDDRGRRSAARIAESGQDGPAFSSLADDSYVFRQGF